MRTRTVVMLPTHSYTKDGQAVHVSAEKATENSAKNVKNVGTYRLNNALASIKTFGQCYTNRFDWTPDQIETATNALCDAVDLAMKNITEGVKIAKAGVKL